jgi:hypothetical protein
MRTGSRGARIEEVTMMQAEFLGDVRPLWRRSLATAAALALGLMLAACDDNRDQSRARNQPEPGTRAAENAPPTAPPSPSPPAAQRDASPPPSTAPGAAPSTARVLGTWTVTESKGVPPKTDGTSDKVEGTTYRFEDGGKVTVAGSKQCTYVLAPAELKIDCAGATMAGKVEFPDNQTMVWTLGANETMTLKKR